MLVSHVGSRHRHGRRIASTIGASSIAIIATAGRDAAAGRRVSIASAGIDSPQRPDVIRASGDTRNEMEAAGVRRLRVAIVEDSANIRERLVQMVEDDKRMQVVGEADTEDSAVAMCRASEPDAIVLDLKLANGTGIGVLKAMRYTVAAKKPTIIVLTNFPLPAFERAARALGADWFLDKTSEFHKLRELLRGLL